MMTDFGDFLSRKRLRPQDIGQRPTHRRPHRRQRPDPQDVAPRNSITEISVRMTRARNRQHAQPPTSDLFRENGSSSMNDDLYQQVCMDHKPNTVKLAKIREIYPPPAFGAGTFFNRLPVTSPTHLAISQRAAFCGRKRSSQ
jgi:hypothetical protein